VSKILIVDDSKVNLEFLSAALKALGHEVIQANTGFEAFEMAKIHEPHVIITDLIMPSYTGTGYDLAKKIREHYETAHIPIIALSAEDDSSEALESGVDIFLSRPLGAHQLRETLKKFV